MLLNQIHFKLHWVKVSSFKCDSRLHREPNDTEPLASLSLLWFQEILEIKFGIFFFFFFYEVMAIRQPKHPSPWFWLLEYFRHHTVFSECSRVCSHSCVYVFPLRAISEGQSVSNFEPNMSQRVWHGTCLFCFCKIEFCCKMHMREFCTEVTIVP